MGGAGYVNFSPDSTNLAGWTVLPSPGGIVSSIGPYFPSLPAQNGLNWLDLSGPSGAGGCNNNSSCGIFQTVSTMPGIVANLSFWLGAAPSGGAVDGQGGGSVVDISINGGPRMTFSNNPSPLPNSLTWQKQSYSFVPTGSTTLTFYNSCIPSAYAGATADFCALDNVSLSQNQVPGPLPILGTVLAFRTSRKLRKRIKSSQLVGASVTPQ